MNRDKLIRQLFFGKVSEIIGFEKTVKLLQESQKIVDEGIKSGALKVNKEDK